MILLDASDGEHIIIGHDRQDVAGQLLQHLHIQDDDQLAMMAATAFQCEPLDVIITRTIP